MQNVFLFLALGCLAVPVLRAQATPRLAELPQPLEWQHAPLSWQSGGPATLSLTAGPHTNWFQSPTGDGGDDNSPRLLFQPVGDFVLSARLDVDFEKQWDAGALVLYLDPTHWAKLCFEYSIEGKPTIVSVVTQGLSDDNNSFPLASHTAYLKIAKSGQAIFFYASADGQHWSIVRSFSFGKWTAPKAGFSAQSPVGLETHVRFSQIRYESGPVDLWKGESRK